MWLRYWLTMCVALPLVTPCEAWNSEQHDNYRYYNPQQAFAGGVWTQLGWPALPKLNKPSYAATSLMYPRWPSPAAVGTHYQVRWPYTRPALPALLPHIHQQQTDPRDAALARPYQSVMPRVPNHGSINRHESQRTSSTRDGTLVSSLSANRLEVQGRRTGNQWVWPRKFLTSSDTGRGSSQSRQHSRGEQQGCENGKVWQNGRCECPYLSNWDTTTNTCECIYGTYRHSSGHCRSY